MSYFYIFQIQDARNEAAGFTLYCILGGEFLKNYSFLRKRLYCFVFQKLKYTIFKLYSFLLINLSKKKP